MSTLVVIGYRVVVPAGTTYKPVTVTADGLTGYSNQPFLVTVQGGDIINSESFSPKRDSALADPGFEPAIGDVDGDGKADVIIAGMNNVLILRNTSTGREISFALPVSMQGELNPYRVSLGDFDGDGKQDLAVVLYVIGQIKIYKNNSTPGNISFTPLPAFSIQGTRPMGLAVIDMDADGRPDVVTEHNFFAYNVSVMRNTTSGGVISFAPKKDLLVGSGGGSFAVADLNQDGLPDIGVYDGDKNRISIIKNVSKPGALAFNPPYFITTGGPLSFADLDNDDRPELIVNQGSFINVFKNIGNRDSAFFAQGITAGSGRLFNTVADINADGHPDIVTFSNDHQSISVIRNKGMHGTLSFGEVINYTPGTEPNFMAIGDLNNDAKPDMVSLNIFKTLSVLRNKIAEPVIVSPNLTGEVFIKVTVDSTGGTVNGNPYLRRHYDIEPVNNPSGITATLTLEYTQQDFDEFNSYLVGSKKLPTGPTDAFGKSNLRVYQYHGTSTSGEPGTYSGPGIEINPDDNRIVWVDSIKIWKVSFEIQGFSGFFIGSSASSILPLKLISFTAEPSASNPLLKWVSTGEVNTKIFELQRSTNGSSFSTLARITAAGNSTHDINYQYRDTLPSAAVYYYRLKMIDIDNHFTYSKIIPVQAKQVGAYFTIFPNPSGELVIVKHPASMNTGSVKLIDLSGRVIRNLQVKRTATETLIDVRGIPKAAYKIVWSDGLRTMVQTLLVK